MLETTNLFIVPVLAAVVLGTMLLTAHWARSSLGLGMLGVFGVLFGGPSTIVLLASDSTDATGPDSSAEVVEDESEVHNADESLSESSSDAALRDVFTDAPQGPEWIGQRDVLKGPVHSVYVLGIEGSDFNEELRKATDAYISDYLGRSHAGRVLNWSVGEIKSRLLAETWHNTRSELGESVDFSHGLLEFNQATRNELDIRWRDAVAKRRTIFAGLVGGSMLALLAVILGYFRLDNATRGFYTGRLQFMAVAAILTLIAVSVVAGRWIPWS